MNAKSFNIKIFTKILKIVLAISLYAVFTLYTIPVYNNIKSLVAEKAASHQRVIIGGRWIEIEVVDTEEERIQGLSGRESLDPNTGMLFVFDTPGTYGIWMKDMNFDIDIIWINKDKEIVHIVENATPESYPNTFIPQKDSLYVLEVQAGFVKSSGVVLGDKVDLY